MQWNNFCFLQQHMITTYKTERSITESEKGRLLDQIEHQERFVNFQIMIKTDSL